MEELRAVEVELKEKVDVPTAHLLVREMDGASFSIPAPVKGDKLSKYRQKFNITNQYSRCGWFCAGQMGLNSLKRICEIIDPEENLQTKILGMNTDAGQIDGIFEEAEEGNEKLSRWLDLPGTERLNLIQLGDGKGAGGRPEVAERAFEDKEDEIEAATESIDMAVFLGGLGGGTSSGVAPKMATLLHRAKDRIGSLAVLTMPFGLEGEKRFERADEARRKVSEQIPVVTIYNNAIYELDSREEYAHLVEGLSEGDFEEAVHRINDNVIVPILRTIHQLIFSRRAIFRRDSEDWRRILEGAKSAYSGRYEFEPGETAVSDPDRILARLLEDPFQHQGIVASSNIALVLFRGSFSPEEMEVLAESIKMRMKGDDRKKEVEVIPGYDKQSDSKDILVLIISPSLPDAKKSSAARAPRSFGARFGNQSSREAVVHGGKNPKAEALNPFLSTTPESLREPYEGRKRQVMLRFQGEEEPRAVYLSPKLFELVQYFEFNWKHWTTSDFDKNYILLKNFFLEYVETSGKIWMPEGVEDSLRMKDPDPASRKALTDSWLPRRK